MRISKLMRWSAAGQPKTMMNAVLFQLMDYFIYERKEVRKLVCETGVFRTSTDRQAALAEEV